MEISANTSFDPTNTMRATKDERLMNAARGLEASFLAEMLKSAGVGAPLSAFGGGAGEEHFSSFLREAQAKAMVDAGGLGLAESIFEAMKAGHDA